MLESFDDRLADRIGERLAVDERLVRVGPRSTRSQGAFDQDSDLLVIDCRDESRLGLDSVILRQLQAGIPDVPWLLIARNGVVPFVEAVGRHDGTSMAVIVPEVEAGGLLVRACLNNAPNSVAATMAIVLVLRYLPPVAAEVLNASIGSGFVSSSVKECAASLYRDRGTLRRHLQNFDRTLVPRDVIDLTKATYAIILLRTTRLSLRAVARAVGFTGTTSLSHLLERIFGLSPNRVRETLTTEAIESYLEILLAACMSRAVVRRAPTLNLTNGVTNESPDLSRARRPLSRNSDRIGEPIARPSQGGNCPRPRQGISGD